MTDFMAPLEVEEIQEAPPVATIWPTTVKFTEDEKSAAELVVKYGHLKQIDIDDKDGYKELVLAIADARNKRLDISKQEDVIKDPINKYRTMLINTSKKIQALFGDVESNLKKEKKRIDDRREERKLEMERLWQENLNIVRNMTEGLPSLSMIKLDCLLYELKKFDFKSLDFGDYIEQAKATVELQINAVNERIGFLKEQQRLEEEKERLRLKQVHQENLNRVNNWAIRFDHETDEGLQVTIDRLETFDLNTMEFGDLLEEANSALNAALNRALTEDERRANARIEKKKQEEADRKQAETDAENQRLRDQIAAMEKENEPEPRDWPPVDENEFVNVEIETPIKEDELVGVSVNGSFDGVDSVTQELPEQAPISGRAAAIEQEPESTVVREEPKQVEQSENFDAVILATWANEINKASGSICGFVLSPKAKNAVNAVMDQLSTISEYLDKTAESLK